MDLFLRLGCEVIEAMLSVTEVAFEITEMTLRATEVASLITFIDGVQGQHAICQTQEINDWLRSLDNKCILPKKPVHNCFVVPFNVLS